MKELTLCTVGIELIGSALQKPRGKKRQKAKSNISERNPLESHRHTHRLLYRTPRIYLYTL